MKPFDLKAALTGAPVVTRDGREVTQLVKFDVKASGQFPLRGVVEGDIFGWSLSGKWITNMESHADLFMAPTKQKVYLRIRKSDLQSVGKELTTAFIDIKPDYSENDLDFEVELEI